MSRVSIKNIAEKVGVSSATVSLVLNGKAKNGRVSKEIAEKVQQAARDLNYEPNNLARSLRSGKSKTIGLIIADITNAFFASLAFYIQEYAEEFGYTVIITNTNESVDKMKRSINILRNQRVDGYIIVLAEGGEKYIIDLIEQKMPVVLLDRFTPNLEVSYVAVDNYHASRNATQFLIDKGCAHIAILVYGNEMFHTQERKRGYVDALKKANKFDKSLVKEIKFETIDADVNKAITELVNNDKKIDGIFFATNTLSIKGLRQLMIHNVKINEDIKVVCFDENEAFDFATVKIPHVSQPIPEMGKRAAGVLIEQIEQNKIVPSKTELYSTLLNT